MFNVLFNQTWGPCIAHSRTSDAFDIHLVSELVPSFHKLVTFQSLSFCPHFLKIYAISSIKQSFSLVDSANDSFWSINLMLVVEVSWFHRCHTKSVWSDSYNRRLRKDIPAPRDLWETPRYQLRFISVPRNIDEAGKESTTARAL